MKVWTTEPAGAKGLQPSVQPSEEAAGLPRGYSPAGPRLGGTAAGTRGQRLWRGGMPRVDCSGASRVRENRMHGSEREGWKRSRALDQLGHRASPLLYTAGRVEGEEPISRLKAP